MQYELPTLPPYFYGREAGANEKCLSIDQAERYAEQAVAPLLAEIERLKRGEFICNRCGLRNNADTPEANF